MGASECCCAENKEGLTIETAAGPMPMGGGESQPDVYYWSQSEQLASRTATTRIDPYDGHVYSFDQIAQKYAGTYTAQEIDAYWENECWPVYDNGTDDDGFRICEFSVRLKKNAANEMLGIGLRKATLLNQVVIKKPRGEALKKWHELNPARVVRDGDEIIAVNGKYGSAEDIVQELTRGNTVEIEMTLRRQTQISVDLTVEGIEIHHGYRGSTGPLGLNLNPETFEVISVTAGQMHSRNQTCKPALEILEGDTLIEVNGMEAQWYDLPGELWKLEQGQHVHLVFSRPGID